MDAIPTLEEIQKAVRLLSSGKAPGSNSNPGEVYNKAVWSCMRNHTKCFSSSGSTRQCHRTSRIPLSYTYKKTKETAKSATVIVESPYCPSQAAPWQDHFIVHLEQGFLPESQCGFRKERGTMNMVFVARQLQEKCQEQNADVYSTYVDLTKVFDTVSHGEVQWLQKVHQNCMMLCWQESRTTERPCYQPVQPHVLSHADRCPQRR